VFYAFETPNRHAAKKIRFSIEFGQIETWAFLWAQALGNPLRTLGFDGFKTEAGTDVVNCTETAGDKCAFKSCVDPGERREDHTFYAETIEVELRSGAAAAGKTVEETYAGVVADNVGYNMKAFKIVQLIFPMLFFFGCIAHCFDLLCEDFAKIPEFAVLIAYARMMAVFIKSHKYVKLAFKRIIGQTGLMVVVSAQESGGIYGFWVFSGSFENVFGTLATPNRHPCQKTIFD
jgi:hypothetical protein